MSHAGDSDEPGRHAASPFRGLKLGLAALLSSLTLPAAVLSAVYRAGGDIYSAGDYLDLSWALNGLLAIPVALTLGVFALRKNRVLGKVFGVLGIVIALALIAYFVWGVLVSERYLPNPFVS